MVWFGLAWAATLELEVSGLKSTDGMVVAALYDQAEGFPTEPSKVRALQVVPAGQLVRFEGLPPGGYAVSLFHDANGNGKLDMWFFGPPREGVACTNDATGRFGPPSFADAAVRLDTADVRQEVAMAYLFAKQGG